MYLARGRQNLLKNSVSYVDSSGWGLPTAIQGSNGISPNGTIAESWLGPTPSFSYYIVSDTSSILATNNIIVSGFFKAYTDDNIKTLFAINGVSYSNTLGIIINFIGGECFFSSTVGLDTISYGVEKINNAGWYRCWFMCDPQATSDANGYFTSVVYPNYTNVSGVPNTGVYIWGLNIQRTKYRTFYSGYTETHGTQVDNGDFDGVNFSLLPSNIEEIRNNLNKYSFYGTGYIGISSSLVYDKVYTMGWDKIDYVKHGEMIYKLNESLIDFCDSSCVIIYPESLFINVRSADINIVDFFTRYTTGGYSMSLAVMYTILNTYNF